MTIEIPAAAIEAVQAEQEGAYVFKHRLVREQLEAALPHLTTVILAGLRERCEGEVEQVDGDRAANRRGPFPRTDEQDWEDARLLGAGQALKLTLSYIDDAERMSK